MKAEPLKNKIRFAEDYYNKNIGRVIEIDNVVSAVKWLKKEINKTIPINLNPNWTTQALINEDLKMLQKKR